MLYFVLILCGAFLTFVVVATLAFARERRKILATVRLDLPAVDYSGEAPQTVRKLLDRLLSAESPALEKVVSLSLSATGLRQLPDLSALRSLRRLELDRNPLESLRGIHKMAASLEYLSLAGTSINDISELKGLNRLRVLDISNTQGVDLTQIDGHRSLRVLFMQDAVVYNSVALTRCPSLQMISLAGSTLKGEDGIVKASGGRVVVHSKMQDWRMRAAYGRVAQAD